MTENGRTEQAEYGLPKNRSEYTPRLLKTDMVFGV